MSMEVGLNNENIENDAKGKEPGLIDNIKSFYKKHRNLCLFVAGIALLLVLIYIIKGWNEDKDKNDSKDEDVEEGKTNEKFEMKKESFVGVSKNIDRNSFVNTYIASSYGEFKNE